MEVKIFESGNVKKFVFIEEDAVYESVLYKYPTYEERTVMCVSVQSGCNVGCVFCGTGKKFIRNLTDREIIDQVKFLVNHVESFKHLDNLNYSCDKFQIMFMSMGEPFLNYENVEKALKTLNYIYDRASLLISSVGIKNNDNFLHFLKLAIDIPQIGLQFSLHNPFDNERQKLIPYPTLSVLGIREYGLLFFDATRRPCYLNYILTENNSDERHINEIEKIFSRIVFNLTFSVFCDPKNDINMKDKNIDKIKKFSKVFEQKGYNVRVFNPDGQDDIGGGCGQLWYVQDWIKKFK